MSQMRQQITAAADALFGSNPDWAAIARAGFPLLLVPEAKGGIGGDWGDAFAVLKVAGGRALPHPVGETMLAAHLLARADIIQPPGLTVIGSGGGQWQGGRFSGWVAAVPWGRDSDHVLAAIDTGGDDPVMLLLPRPTTVTPGQSPAGEPRDRLDYVAVSALALGSADHSLYGAFLRTAQSSGALDAALALAIDHVNSRVQFGKPLAKLQAVQQSLAVLAQEAAATAMAGAAAAQALDKGQGAMEMMAAKLRANMAIHKGVALAHQVHGAIGFTQDYPLQRLTRRLMGWRSEFGGDRWAELLGAATMLESGQRVWTDIARRSDL